MALTVTVLGCSGSYPSATTACTGFLVQTATTSVWLDAGPGTTAMIQQHLQLTEVDAIVLTHEHPDHWLELPIVATALKHYLGGTGLPVFGTRGTRVRAEAALGRSVEPTMRWQTIADGDAIAIGDQHWRFCETEHTVETLAPRVDHGDRALGFSADTGPGWSLASLGEGLSLAIVESTYAQGERPDGASHLTATEAGATAAEAGAERLVLSHLLPGSDAAEHRRQAERTFGAAVEIATANERYQV